MPARLGYQPALDGVRAVAIAGVLGIHAGLVPGGDVGVTVFFTLSGFLITTLLLEERAATGSVDLRTFYLRRAFRLLPALFLALAATAAVTAYHRAVDDQHLVLAYLASIFYFANVVPIAVNGHALGSLVWTWSLSLEEQFYLLWPSLCRRVLRHRSGSSRAPGRPGLRSGVGRPRLRSGAEQLGLRSGAGRPELPGLRPLAIVAAVLALAAVGVRAWLSLTGHGHGPHIYYGTGARMDGLLVGCLAAMWRQRQVHRHGTTMPRPRAVAALAVAGVAASYSVRGLFDARLLVSELATAALLLALATAPTSRVARVLALAPLVRIGKISYSVYLWNLLVLDVFEIEAGRPPHGWEWLAWAAACLLVAEASYRFVERPVLRRAPRPRRRAPERSAESEQGPAYPAEPAAALTAERGNVSADSRAGG